MRKWLERIRGVLGTALTWAVAWSGVGVLLGLVGGVVAPGAASTVDWVVTLVRVFGPLGFVGGAVFSTVLAIAEGRRRFDEMSLPRFAAWGAVGAFLVSAFLVSGDNSLLGFDKVLPILVMPLLGAGSAAGSLALARSADDRELLDAGADVAGSGLTKAEKVELLGK